MIGKQVALLQIPNQRLFSVKAAAQYLGISKDTLRKYADLGRVKARRMGNRRVFALEDLNAFIDALPDYNTLDYTGFGGKPGRKEAENGS